MSSSNPEDEAEDSTWTHYEVQLGATADGGGRVPNLSPREARDRWLDKLRVSKTDSTVSSYHYRTKHFVEWCEAEGIDLIRDVSGWDIESFETKRRADDLAPITLNKEMGTLQGFLEYCARIELVDENLPEKVDPPEVSRDAHIDDTKLHPKDAERLLDFYENDPEMRHTRAHALLAFAWYTGARLGGIRAVDLRDYNSDDELVEFYHRPDEDTPLKNGYDGERHVGLPTQVCEILDNYIEKYRHKKFDDYGRQPLFTSEVGRPHTSTIRPWMNLATVPCLHTTCPHGNERPTCDYLYHNEASKCPSSRSPHQVRTGSITWQRHRGVPPEVVAERVNSSVRVIEEHYDVPSKREEMEERRRPHIDRLNFDEEGDGE